MPATEPRSTRSWVGAVTTLVVTVVVLGPLLVGRGFALRGDMVFVPDQPAKAAWWGLDGSVPRSVPMDGLIAVVDNLVPGQVLQRLLLVAALLAGGLGIARLARASVPAAQAAAVVVYLWNPWVYGRLEIGQWATVLGYGLLPWLVLAASRARDGDRRGWAGAALLLVGTAVCAPSVGLIGAAVAFVVILLGRDLRRVGAALGLSAVANLPWIVPALLGPSLRGNDLGFSEFAARGESSLGTLASLLSMGGIWKTSIAAPERTHAVVVATAAVLAVLLAAGLRYAVPLLGRRTTAALAGLGAASFLVALLPSIGPVGRALGSLSEHTPALALLRDSQRFLAPVGLVLALGAAALVDRLVTAVPARNGDRGGALVLAGGLLIAPVLLLPSLGWGLSGDLSPRSYPDEWSQVADQVGAAGAGHGAVVVLPWRGSYRGFAWNDDRAVLDPAPRFLPGEVLIDDRVFGGAETIPSEDPYLVEIADALEARDPAAALRELGVGWVLEEKQNGVEDAPEGDIVHDGPGLRLIDVNKQETSVENPRHEPPMWPVSLANAITASVVVISIWYLTRYKRG